MQEQGILSGAYQNYLPGCLTVIINYLPSAAISMVIKNATKIADFPKNLACVTNITVSS